MHNNPLWRVGIAPQAKMFGGAHIATDSATAEAIARAQRYKGAADGRAGQMLDSSNEWLETYELA